MLQNTNIETKSEVSNQPKNRTKAKVKGRSNGTTTNTKTIKTPGTRVERVAQACDRCRAKKTKCDGKVPTCSSCAAVGFKCIVSDKLSRRAFPKGYTETLEERIRQLEIENKKLVGILDLRDEQLDMLNTRMNGQDSSFDDIRSNGSTKDNDMQPVTSSNLYLLDKQHTERLHEHDDGCPCGCSNFPHSMHERPVSIAGSVYDTNTGQISVPGSINLSDDDDNESLLSGSDILLIYSLHKLNANIANLTRTGHNIGGEANPAPGAFAAATAIAQMQKDQPLSQQQQLEHRERNKKQMLTSLVAMSIPRSTEETLFIPTLLSKICQVHGYDSKPAILTANAIASLKENTNETMKNDSSSEERNDEILLKLIMNRSNLQKLPESEAIYFIRNLISLPNSRIDLDHLITVYFQDWGNAFPIIDKNSFLKKYVKFTELLELGLTDSFSKGESTEPIEKFAVLMILILSLSLLSNKHSHMSSKNNTDLNNIAKKYVSSLNHYDYLIHQFINPNCIMTKYCSIQSLQILSLALQYCLVIGDITTCYELRCRVITMAQQLRLHRCPAAVLGVTGHNGGSVHLQNFMQGERRILFWCIYCLDIYSSLSLGVPRLLKDFEIECALPFAGKNDDDNDDNENILIVNNTKLSIVGKVSKFALSVMLYCKVLGRILDSIFARFENMDGQNKALDQERMLDCWRRELPVDLKFDIDVNGFSLADSDSSSEIENSSWKNYSKQQLTLIFLYYHAKFLIYLPIISKYGNHYNVGLLQKEQLTKEKGDIGAIVSSVSMIQQSSTRILEVLKSLSKYSSSYVLPIPINISRQQARFALLVAKGSLDYIKGGPLYQNLKALLLDTIAYLLAETNHEIPGGLTKNSVRLLEFAVLSIFGLSLNKAPQNIKKKPNPSNVPITKMAVAREPISQPDTYNNSFIRPKHISSKTPSPTVFDKNTSPQDNNNVSITKNEDDIPMEQQEYGSYFSPLDPEGSQNNSNGLFNDDGHENLESILKFDPFKVTLNSQLMMNEFAADGSLGLVPFLDMSNSTIGDEAPLSYDESQVKIEDLDPKLSDSQYSSFFQWP
mmetsp:Transcript_2993/g.3330  ORF Transcript_2993/g.3330 Transcript_2993/m.3330 type:complete len:1068 (+) Transcript_2993:72-3275(+)